MTMYWSLKHVPELANLSLRHRLAVHRACAKRHVNCSQCKKALGAVRVGTYSGAAIGLAAYLALAVPSSWWVVAIGAGIGGGIGGYYYGSTLCEHLRPAYADYIASELRSA